MAQHDNMKRIGREFIDQVYDPEELKKEFPVGMSKEDVRRKIGAPNQANDGETSEFWEYEYDERNPKFKDLENIPDLLTIIFRDEVTFEARVRWKSRKVMEFPKVLNRAGSRKIHYLYPEEKQKNQRNLSRFAAGITIENPEEKPTTTDLSELLGHLSSITFTFDGSAPDKFPASCDILQYLADYLPELEPYKNSKEMLDAEELVALIEPYTQRKKPFPPIK